VAEARRTDRPALAAFWVIVAIYLAIGSLYALRTPVYNAPDEPAHANYVRALSRREGLPVLVPGDWDLPLLEDLKARRFPEGSDVAAIRYESHQPPIYYLVLAPLAQIVSEERAQVVVMRFGSLAIGLLGVVLIYHVARCLLDADAALLAMGFAAFLPMRVAVSTSVSNDIAVELLVTAALLLALNRRRTGVGPTAAAMLGGLAALAFLSKLSGVACVAIAGSAILLFPVRARKRSLAIASAVYLAGIVPWLVRGAIAYGPLDPLGLSRHDQVVVAQARTGPLDAEIIGSMASTLFRSFWGQFGWMGVLMDERLYLGLAMFSLVIALGIGLFVSPWGSFWTAVDRRDRGAWLVAAAPLVVVAAMTALYNLTYLQPQGRYLFPAMATVGLAVAAGLREIVATRQRIPVFGVILSLMVAIDLICLFAFIEPQLRT